MIPVLETERLVLRAPTPADLPGYVAFYTDGEASAFYGGPVLPHEAYFNLCRDLGHWDLNGFGVWAVTDRKTGAFLGTTGLMRPEGWPRSELTWWLLPQTRGQGFATEASRAAIAWGYDHLGWDLVETHMKDTNAPARALVQRLGGEKIDRIAFPDGLDRDILALPHPEKVAA